MRFLVFTILLLVNGVAGAIPVTWNFQDVTLSDGGVVTGSFVFDADAPATANNSYTSINVTSTDGSLFMGAAYADCLFLCSIPTTVVLETPDRERRLWIKLDEGMTNAGGTIFLTQGCLPDPCGSFEDTLSDTGERFVTAGAITAVPIPAAVWLLGSALAGLGWLKRKQSEKLGRQPVFGEQ